MKNKQILIIDRMHESIVDLLSDQGFDPIYSPKISREEIKALPDDFVGMIVRSKTNVDEELIGHLTSLKFVGRAGAGIDLLDVDYLQSRNITVVNAPEGNRDALGEHALGMLLSLAIQLPKSDQEVKDFVWDREGNRGFEVKDKTVGLLGYGYMASAFAEKLSGLGCEVIAYDKYKTSFSDAYVSEVSMEEIFERADILSLHVPLTDETRGLVDADFLASFHKNIILINTSRGEVLRTEAALQALDSGKVSYAALDVLENEKMKTLSPTQKQVYAELFSRRNVILSPHVGGWTVESYRKINEVLLDKICKLGI